MNDGVLYHIYVTRIMYHNEKFMESICIKKRINRMLSRCNKKKSKN